MSGETVSSATMLEGVADEVVIWFTVVACITAALLWCLLSRRPSPGVHPDSEEGVAGVRALRPRPPAPDRRCPVCLGSLSLAVETNCGHIFCGECIIAYWRHGRWLGAVNCPLCRQLVTLLLPSFTAEEVLQDSAALRQAYNDVNDYNRRFSGLPRPLLDYIWDLPTLLRHAFTELFSLSGMVWMFRLRLVTCCILALLYLISPLDIIPEAVFGLLGWIDDVVICLLLAVYISLMYRNFVGSRPDHHVHTD